MTVRVPSGWTRADASSQQITDAVRAPDHGAWVHRVNWLLGWVGMQPFAEGYRPWIAGAEDGATHTWRWKWERPANVDAIFVQIVPRQVTAVGGSISINGAAAGSTGSRRYDVVHDYSADGLPTLPGVPRERFFVPITGTGWLELTIAFVNIRPHVIRATMVPREILDIVAGDKGCDVANFRTGQYVQDDTVSHGLRALAKAIHDAKAQTLRHLIGQYDNDPLLVTATTLTNIQGIAGAEWRCTAKRYKAETTAQAKFQLYAQAVTNAATVRVTEIVTGNFVDVPVAAGSAGFFPASPSTALNIAASAKARIKVESKMDVAGGDVKVLGVYLIDNH